MTHAIRMYGKLCGDDRGLVRWPGSKPTTYTAEAAEVAAGYFNRAMGQFVEFRAEPVEGQP